MTTNSTLKTGLLVRLTAKPEWGLGKVVHLTEEYAYVVFRDLPGDVAKKFVADSSPLIVAEVQSDPFLDYLPPVVQRGADWVLPRARIPIQQAITHFLNSYPLGFADPEYVGTRKRIDGQLTWTGERQYKWVAHQHFEKELGGSQARELLSNNLVELRSRSFSIISKVNLLSIFENAALRDALQNEAAATEFFRCLIDLLEAPTVNREVFEPFAESVCALPSMPGKHRVASWPVATILPFLAQPKKHMFLKPQFTKEAAERLGFDLHYDPKPNWTTYQSVLRLGEILMNVLNDFKPCDFIDIQSFIWFACGGAEGMPDKK